MKKIQYEIKWKPFTNLKADVNKVCKEIEIIQKETGNITAEEIYNYGKKNKSSELNICFEWNKEKAAYQYNLDQARYILNHIVIEYKNPDFEVPLQTRKYEVITIKNKDVESQKNYVDIIMAISKKDQRQEIYKNISKSIDDLKEKLDNYNKLTELILK